MARAVWILLALAAGSAGALYFRSGPDADDKPPAPGSNPWAMPVPVRSVPARREDLTLEVRSIGTVTALNTVVVRSRVDGQLLRVAFQEGQRVRAGQLLAEIDPEPYRIRLAQALGNLEQDVAQLKNAEAELAQYERVIAQGTIPRQTLDRQQALVNQLRGTIRANQAQVDDARLQLDYTRIVAPIDGRLGLRQVDAGNLVRSGDAAGLVTITQTQPISVLFTVPEGELPAIRAESARGRPLVLEAWDREGRTRLAAGSLRTLDNQIDTATGTLRLKGQFENRDDALFPNQFVNVVLKVATLPGVVTLPADAVQFGSRGTYVYVLDGGKARIREVRTGVQAAGRLVVEDGLAPGEQVVLEGLDRLRDGSDVQAVD